MPTQSSRCTERQGADNSPGSASNPYTIDGEDPGAYWLGDATADSNGFMADAAAALSLAVQPPSVNMEGFMPMPVSNMANNMEDNMSIDMINMTDPMLAGNMFGSPMSDMVFPDMGSQLPFGMVNLPNDMSTDPSAGMSPTHSGAFASVLDFSPGMPITEQMSDAAFSGTHEDLHDVELPIYPFHFDEAMHINSPNAGAMSFLMTSPMSTAAPLPTQTSSAHVSAPFPEHAPAPAVPSSMPVYEMAPMPVASPVQAMSRDSENQAAQDHMSQSVSPQQQQMQNPHQMHYPHEHTRFYTQSSHTQHMQTPEPSQPVHQSQPMYTGHPFSPQQPPQQQLPQQQPQHHQPQYHQPPQQQPQHHQPHYHQPQHHQPQYHQPQHHQPPQQQPQHHQPHYHQPQHHQPQHHQPQYHQPQYHQPQYHQPPHHQPQHHQPQYHQPQHHQLPPQQLPPQQLPPQHQQYGQFLTSTGPQPQSVPFYSPHGQQSPTPPAFTQQPTYHHPSPPQALHPQTPHPSQTSPPTQHLEFENSPSVIFSQVAQPSAPRQSPHSPQQQTTHDKTYTPIAPRDQSSEPPAEARRSTCASTPNTSARSAQTSDVPGSHKAAQPSRSMPPPPVPNARHKHYSTPTSDSRHYMPSQASASDASFMPPPSPPQSGEQSQPPASEQTHVPSSDRNPGRYMPDATPSNSSSDSSHTFPEEIFVTYPSEGYSGGPYQLPRASTMPPDPTLPTHDEMIQTMARSQYPLSREDERLFRKYNSPNMSINDIVERNAGPGIVDYHFRLRGLENYCRMRLLYERLAEDARAAARAAAAAASSDVNPPSGDTPPDE